MLSRALAVLARDMAIGVLRQERHVQRRDGQRNARCSSLRCSEGRRFLSFLFTISAPFIDQLHGAIKNQLPTCRASLLENYGEVDYRVTIV